MYEKSAAQVLYWVISLLGSIFCKNIEPWAKISNPISWFFIDMKHRYKTIKKGSIHVNKDRTPSEISNIGSNLKVKTKVHIP